MGETSPTAKSELGDLGYDSPAGPQGPVRRSGKVVRGGSWNNNQNNARAARRAPIRGGVPVMGGDAGQRPEVKEEEQRRACLVCAPYGGTGHCWRQAYTQAGAQPGRERGPHYARPFVCLIQPPRSLPISAIIPLMCSYWPLLNHCH
ncbi:MAG: hypothetical protein M1546_21740 [Chloroflexi bacterium]|nr:hypothetical protein [Chloroflexota bacterium]